MCEPIESVPLSQGEDNIPPIALLRLAPYMAIDTYWFVNISPSEVG